MKSRSAVSRIRGSRIAKAAKRDKARARPAETRLDFRDTKSGDCSTHWFPFAVVTIKLEERVGVTTTTYDGRRMGFVIWFLYSFLS